VRVGPNGGPTSHLAAGRSRPPSTVESPGIGEWPDSSWACSRRAWSQEVNKAEAKVAAIGAVPPRERWLNRNVMGMGVTSLLSDWGHEMATAVLPAFMAAIGAPAAALGAIEGIADAVSSFVKLGAGWYTDRIGHRKAICVGGYFLTGISKAIFAFAAGWPLVLFGRT